MTELDEREYDKAIADDSEAIRLKRDFAEAFYNRGFAYCRLDECDEAIAEYCEAIRKPRFRRGF